MDANNYDSFEEYKEYQKKLIEITISLDDHQSAFKHNAIERPEKYNEHMDLSTGHEDPIARPKIHDPLYYLAIDIYNNVEHSIKMIERFSKYCAQTNYTLVLIRDSGTYNATLLHIQDLIKFIKTFREHLPNPNLPRLTQYTEFKRSFLHVNKRNENGWAYDSTLRSYKNNEKNTLEWYKYAATE